MTVTTPLTLMSLGVNNAAKTGLLDTCRELLTEASNGKFNDCKYGLELTVMAPPTDVNAGNEITAWLLEINCRLPPTVVRLESINCSERMLYMIWNDVPTDARPESVRYERLPLY